MKLKIYDHFGDLLILYFKAKDVKAHIV